MPSKIDDMRIGRENDRRFKLSEADIERIRELYSEGITKSELARRFGVSINTVRCYLSSEERERALASMREYSSRRPPRDKKCRAEYVRSLRKRKKEIYGEVLKNGPMGR